MAGSMNPEVKAQWVEALRSGRYKQTKGLLQDENGFCCLGVLCDLAVKAGKVTARKTTTDATRYGRDGVLGSLPEEVMEWADVASVSPRVRTAPADFDEGLFDLADLNDEYGYGFREIADLIDAQL